MEIEKEYRELKLTGYANKISVRPKEIIEFKISSTEKKLISASCSRIISADPNPNGPGIIQEDASKFFKPIKFLGKYKPFYPGSYAISKNSINFVSNNKYIIEGHFYPTFFSKNNQCIINIGSLEIFINSNNELSVTISNQILRGGKVKLKNWTFFKVSFSFKKRELLLTQKSDEETEIFKNKFNFNSKIKGNFVIASRKNGNKFCDFFNGKIDSTKLKFYSESNHNYIINYDFTKNISSTTIFDKSENKNHAQLINFPTRAVTGHKWDGSEMNWKNKLEHYSAIHFHEDDIYDFGWETDFKFKIPPKMKSGIYSIKIQVDDFYDYIPFIISSPLKRKKQKLCLVLPTLTYIIYGNHSRPDFSRAWNVKTKKWNGYKFNPSEYPHYGLSTYNFHKDGSGICHASHLRPLLNLRPGYITFGNSKCSGLRHIQADTHIISWLEQKKIEYDVITDHDLISKDNNILENYNCVLTSTHPEYHTENTRKSFLKYSKTIGNLVYLGGNGFYWKVVLHNENTNIIEIRRSEDGIRAWASEPGEYYHAFDGSYGGLWRRQGKAPQKIVGIGFTAQGNFNSSYYLRKNFDKKYNWIFKNISEKKIGNFGLSGFGAAGFELDRVDYHLGSPEGLIILASSEKHGKDFMLVPEEQLTHITNLSGLPEKNVLRADIIYYENPIGGKLFSVGSITFCGSLPFNNFKNNVSKLLKNVVDRFILYS